MAPNNSAFLTGVLSSAPLRDLPGLLRSVAVAALGIGGVDELYRAASSKNKPGGLSQTVLDDLGVSIHAPDSDLARIPAQGAVVIVANHPFGLLDGLVMDVLLRRVRPDLRILTNSILCDVPELHDRCLGVDVFGGRDAVNANSRAIRAAVRHLQIGGVVAVFPSGEVSHWDQKERQVVDPPWNPAAAALARLTRARVVPVFFEGANGVLFQMAGLVHPALRTARLAGELLNKRGKQVEVRIGTAISPRELSNHPNDAAATQYLRARTLMLKHRPQRPPQAGGTREDQPVPAVQRAPGEQEVLREIAGLQARDACVLETGDFAVYRAQGGSVPALMQEIGRQREAAFRAVGEGTGMAVDLDHFDNTYHHLVLWSKQRNEVAGGYRLAWTPDILPAAGVNGLYTSTLFRYDPAFFERMGPAVEIGRSFIRAEYQKDFAPLLLLWQAIARSIAQRPGAPVLFGAVSISDEYCAASQEMMIRFITQQHFCQQLSGLVKPRKPIRLNLRGSELRLLAETLTGIDDLNAPIRDLEEGRSVPVLLRQYLKLGGQIIAFNRDRHFSNAVDALLFVDLRKTDRRILGRYMGADTAAEFAARTGAPGGDQLPDASPKS